MGEARFFDRSGAPVDFDTWLDHQSDPAYTRVARIEIGEVTVSTVWTGMCSDDLDPPLVFETLVSGPGLVRRYLWSTEDAAVAGHVRLVEWLTFHPDDP